jgi:heme exporter protein A
LLQIENLACVRGDRPLFRNLSFSLQPGEFLHILGTNGSGKTTLLRTLCGLSTPAEGVIKWNGLEVDDIQDEFRRQLCYVGHHNGIQGEFTAVENLAFDACLSGAAAGEKITRALSHMGLTRVSHLPAKLLSQGQKRRLALARLLVTDKPLWVLDEPVTALDVRSAALMTELFATHLGRGGLIALTSHQEVVLTTHAVRTISLDS